MFELWQMLQEIKMSSLSLLLLTSENWWKISSWKFQMLKIHLEAPSPKMLAAPPLFGINVYIPRERRARESERVCLKVWASESDCWKRRKRTLQMSDFPATVRCCGPASSRNICGSSGHVSNKWRKPVKCCLNSPSPSCIVQHISSLAVAVQR